MNLKIVLATIVVLGVGFFVMKSFVSTDDSYVPEKTAEENANPILDSVDDQETH